MSAPVLGEIEPGTALLLRFESHFNTDATQTAVAEVAEGGFTNSQFAEVELEDESGQLYMLDWNGVVERRTDDGEWAAYGDKGRLFLLEQVDLVDDEEGPDARNHDAFIDGDN